MVVLNPAALLGGADPADMPLPPLRQDVQLCPGATQTSGAPTWQLYDPARNQYFQIGWTEFECLQRWRTSRNFGHLLKQVNTETTLSLGLPALDAMVTFLKNNQLLLTETDGDIQALRAQTAQQAKLKQRQLANRLLFLRIRLGRPDAFLTRTLPWVKPIFTRTFLLIMLGLLLVDLYLVMRQWDDFRQTFVYFMTLKGLLYYALALLLAKCVHELGHAYTAKFLGCRVPAVGLALMVFWPVFYTDTTDAWKLTNPRQRMAIGVAGMVAEMGLAIVATLGWALAPDGFLRSTLFIVAAVSWVITWLVNLNPFIRFDGYYLLSDALGVNNLQARAFLLGRWRLREWLFNCGESAPVRVTTKMRRILLLYAYATWVYRLFLFIAICTIVYFLFFKVLGLILLAVTAYSFLLKPIGKELYDYWQRRALMTWNRRTVLSLILLGGLVLLLVLPWRTQLQLPALLEAGQHTKIFTPLAAQVAAVHVKPGQRVVAGQLLYTLVSPDLNYERALAADQVQLLDWQLKHQHDPGKQPLAQQVDVEELSHAMSHYQALTEQAQTLNIVAPFAGEIASMQDGLAQGHWLAEHALIAELVDVSQLSIEAYVSEQDLPRIHVGDQGSFTPNNSFAERIPVRIVAIDDVNTTRLNKPYLASTFGGGVVVEQTHKHVWRPKETVYRVRLKPTITLEPERWVRTGQLQLVAEPRSLLGRAWLSASAAFMRESGF